MTIERREIIIKVISGNATGEEVVELDLWRKESSQNEAFYQEILLVWTNIGKAKTDLTTNPELAWQQLLERKNRKRKVWPASYKIAASVALLIVMGVVANYFLNSESKSPISDKNITAPAQVVLEDTTNQAPLPAFPAKKEVIKKQIFETGKQGKEFVLPDKSWVYLEKDSRLVFYMDSLNGEYVRRSDIKGLVYFKVLSAKTPFVVKSKYIDVRVVGTMFMVKAIDGDKTHEVSVEEGVVQVWLQNKPEIKTRLEKDDLYTYSVKKNEAKLSHEKHKKSRWKKFWSGFRNLFGSNEKNK
ncbi:MAG: FecR domain-containing protein [Bacteroidia bacterium]|nr:FecR domain-containing protein [Bacteroidia bacterium]